MYIVCMYLHNRVPYVFLIDMVYSNVMPETVILLPTIKHVVKLPKRL